MSWLGNGACASHLVPSLCYHRLRTMAKMARAHTSGQHALSCTAVEPGHLDAAAWRLRTSGGITARLNAKSGLGAAVSEVCSTPLGATPARAFVCTETAVVAP